MSEKKTFNFIFISDGDRYSSVNVEVSGNIITSCLKTTKLKPFHDYPKFTAYTLDQDYRSIVVHVRPRPFANSRVYNHTCSYTEPSHLMVDNELTAQTSFACDIVAEQKERYTGLYYIAETVNQQGTYGTIVESSYRLDVSSVTENGQIRVTKTIRRNKEWLEGKEGGILGLFMMTIEINYSDRGLVSSFDYLLEDNKSFDGTRDNPFLPGVFAIWRFAVSQGAFLMNNREQTFIYCKAFGYEIPNTDVYKVTSEGNEVPLTYPKFFLRTKYSIMVHYVINYPTRDDAGTFICKTKIGSITKNVTITKAFEPANPPMFDKRRCRAVVKHSEVCPITVCHHTIEIFWLTKCFSFYALYRYVRGTVFCFYSVCPFVYFSGCLFVCLLSALIFAIWTFEPKGVLCILNKWCPFE